MYVFAQKEGGDTEFTYNPDCVRAANSRQRRLIGAHTSGDVNDGQNPYGL